jgi:hypothetical protein
MAGVVVPEGETEVGGSMEPKQVIVMRRDLGMRRPDADLLRRRAGLPRPDRPDHRPLQVAMIDGPGDRRS